MILPIQQLLSSVLKLTCPVCLQGRVFTGLFDTKHRCDNCGYFFSRDSGYFSGAVIFGYSATIALSLGSWPFLKYVLGIESDRVILALMIVLALGFPLWFLRYARMLWMALDLYLNPPVTEDFELRGRPAGR